MRNIISNIAIFSLILCCSCNTQAQRHITGLELPAIKDSATVVVHAGYTASFNSKNMIPNWVAYELTASELKGTVSRPGNSPFQPDSDYRGRQPERRDYTNTSGWDKGHLAPAGDMKWSEQAMIESFYLTNVCPQDHDFNAGDWERLEDHARRIARKKGALYIICGPIVGDNTHGKLGRKVVIPDSFFKAFLYQDSSGYHSIAYLMPNRQTGQPLNTFALSVNDLESLLGMDLFTHLDVAIQEAVEAQLNSADWK